MTDVHVLTGEALPASFADLDDPPARLWVRGTLPTGPTVAIVGTRRSDLGANAFAHTLARQLAAAGIGVVSGGAEGVDGAAHEGALAGRGRTWVVLPTPIARPYPERHRPLFERAVEGGGGWLSEQPPDRESQRFHFLARNRLIAALADVTVVVQAPLKSGAMGTASWAKKLRRPLFAPPASPWDRRSAGNRKLLAEGARPCLGVDDVAAALGREASSEAAERSRPVLEPTQQRVLEALDQDPSPVHEIVRRTGLGVIRVRVALIQLAARDLADQRPGGWLAVA